MSNDKFKWKLIHDARPEHIDDDLYCLFVGRNDDDGEYLAVWGGSPERVTALAEKTVDALNNFEFEFETT